jgi:hypothetical protein
VTAGEAVVELMPLFRPKAVEEGLRYPVQKAGFWIGKLETKDSSLVHVRGSDRERCERLIV